MQLVGNQISLPLGAMFLKQYWHNLGVLMIYNTATWTMFGGNIGLTD